MSFSPHCRASTWRTIVSRHRYPAQKRVSASRGYSTAAEPPLIVEHRRSIKLSHALGVTTLVALGAYALGTFYPPKLVSLVAPRPAAPPPDADSPQGRALTQRIESEIATLKSLQEHRKQTGDDEWYESRPYKTLAPEKLANNFTGGALRRPGMIAVPPVVRAKRDETEAVVWVHLGRGVCGHDGVVHGGLLATLLDEASGRNAVLAFPSRIGVTANLNIDYKSPALADQWIKITTRLVELKGRKAIVEASLETNDGTLLARSRALFVEPKAVAMLHNAPAIIRGLYPTAPSLERVGLPRDGIKNGEGGGQVVDAGAVGGEPSLSKG